MPSELLPNISLLLNDWTVPPEATLTPVSLAEIIELPMRTNELAPDDWTAEPTLLLSKERSMSRLMNDPA
jgi:hypothetical protein